MISVTGTWYDGKTSARVQAVCLVYDNGSVCLERLEDGHRLLCLPQFDVQVSPRLADTPRFLYFPGGGKLETEHNETVDRLIAELKRPGKLSFVHRLESRWRYVSLAFAVLLLFLFGTVQYGVPSLAKVVAFRLPYSVLGLASQQTLGIMDRTLLSPSELEPERQQQLMEHFRPVIQNHLAYNPTVLFRNGERVGPNAFALPNGTIVFTDEMVRLAEQDDQLVAVLAHEIGHVVHRHGMRTLIQDSILGFTLLAITGDVSGSSELFLGLPVVLAELAYSREFEREADHYALTYLRSNNIPPHHFATLMRSIEKEMQKKGRTSNGKWLSYLSTHPLTQERIKRFEVDRD